MRRVLGRVAIAWLFCQASALTFAPVVFWYGSAEAGRVECRCTHGDHAVCPMHHKPAPGSKICLMQSADDSSRAVLSWLLNVGVVPAPGEAVVLEPTGRRLVFEISVTAPGSLPPDPPPPRA
jgi:hypothetical protein